MSEIIESGIALGKAQKRIFKAFLELSGIKSIDKITVSELCERADVNRSTFYRYYYDIYDLQSKMQDYSIESIVKFCSTLDFGLSPEHDCANMVNDGLSKYNDELSTAILKASVGDDSMAQKMYSRLMQAVPPFLEKLGIYQDEQIIAVIRFILNGVIFYCVDNINDFSIKDFYDVAIMSVSTFNTYVSILRRNGGIATALTNESPNASSSKKRESLSVMKTKRSLKRAFSELMRNKKSDKISVSELCSKAEVSHSTFYNHFKGIDDFIDSVRNEMVSGFINVAKKVFDTMEDGSLRTKELFGFIEKNQGFILSMRNNTRFGEKLFGFPQQFAESFYEIVSSKYDCTKYDSHLAFYLICYCAWSSLFQPYGDDIMPANQVMDIAYSMFKHLFKPKESVSE